MGILDGFTDSLNDPNNLALLGFASGIGDAASPSRLPVSLGAAMARGYENALRFKQAGTQQQLLNQEIQQRGLANAMQMARFRAMQSEFPEVFGASMLQGGQSSPSMLSGNPSPSTTGMLSGNPSGTAPISGQSASAGNSQGDSTSGPPVLSGNTAIGHPPAAPPPNNLSTPLFTHDMMAQILRAQLVGIPNDAIAKRIPAPTEAQNAISYALSLPAGPERDMAMHAAAKAIGLPPGYRIGVGGTMEVDPGYVRGESALAGGRAYATLGPDVLKELSSRAGMPIKLGPNETVESGFAALPQPAQDAILGAITGGRGVPTGGGGTTPIPSARPPIGGYTLGSAPSPVSGLPLNGGATSSTASAPTPSTPAPRAPESFAVQNLFNGSNDLPAPPRAQPFPTTPIRNADGSITSPYSTSTIGLQEEANKAYGVAHDQFNAGQAIQQRLAMIDHGIDLLNQSGWSSTGTGAETKLEGLKSINSFLTTIGAPTVANPDKIASFEDLMKETGNLGLDRARAMGSREAAQVVTLSIGLNPGVHSTAAGAKAIEASMGAAAQRDVDYYKFATAYAQQNGSTFGADVAFNQARPPELYARKAIAATIPQPAITALMNPPRGAPRDIATQFDAKYGRGMSAFILKGTLDGMPYANSGSSIGPGQPQAPQFPRYGGAPVPVQ